MCVKNYGIYHECDECPCFFWVPAPIGPPAYVCPDGTYENAKSHSGDGWIKENAAKYLKHFCLTLHTNAQDATDESEGKQSITHHDNTYMNAQQRRIQHWHYMTYGWVHLVDMTYQQEEARQQKTKRCYEHREVSPCKCAYDGDKECKPSHTYH